MTNAEIYTIYASLATASLENAERAVDLAHRIMAIYFTPFEGHKVSPASSVEVWRDFLLLAQSGQRSAPSEKEALVWFGLECAAYNQLRDWNVADLPPVVSS